LRRLLSVLERPIKKFQRFSAMFGLVLPHVQQDKSRTDNGPRILARLVGQNLVERFGPVGTCRRVEGVCVGKPPYPPRSSSPRTSYDFASHTPWGCKRAARARDVCRVGRRGEEHASQASERESSGAHNPSHAKPCMRFV
jgi:hypothetical protein